MATYLEYELEDGSALLVEIKGSESDTVKAGNLPDRDGNVIVRAGRKFTEAFDVVKAQAVTLQHKLKEAKADEVEVKFSLKATGEAGNFAIGNVGAEASYEVTLKWKNRKQA